MRSGGIVLAKVVVDARVVGGAVGLVEGVFVVDVAGGGCVVGGVVTGLLVVGATEPCWLGDWGFSELSEVKRMIALAAVRTETSANRIADRTFLWGEKDDFGLGLPPFGSGETLSLSEALTSGGGGRSPWRRSVACCAGGAGFCE